MNKKNIFLIIIAVLFTIQLKAQVKVGNNPNTIDSSAILEMESTNKGFVFSRMTNVEMLAIKSPDAGLTIYNTTKNKICVYNGTYWACTEDQVFTCGSVLIIPHTAGDVAPVNKTVNYGTDTTSIGGTGKKCWITQNLGADRQALSATDATEASAGWYWQFNTKQGYKHDGTTRTPSTTWNSAINENSNWEASKDPCSILLGSGWRIPTRTEWTNADATGGWVDYDNDATGTFGSILKLHATGFISTSGGLSSRGSLGYYLSNQQNAVTTTYILYLSNSNAVVSSSNKANGFSVRCIKD